MSPNGAAFSPCRTYRYALWRHWGSGLSVAFVGLNPSTADETADDPTIRRCIGYAKAWGFAGLWMVNLFALRATDPNVMLAHPEPVGPDNDFWLSDVSEKASRIIAAWGAHGSHRSRAEAVTRMLAGKLHALGRTKSGEPRHPLYLRADAIPQPFLGSRP